MNSHGTSGVSRTRGLGEACRICEAVRRVQKTIAAPLELSSDSGEGCTDH